MKRIFINWSALMFILILGIVIGHYEGPLAFVIGFGGGFLAGAIGILLGIWDNELF